MAPTKLSDDEIDDLVYLARTGEDAELAEMLKEVAAREEVAAADVLDAARDDSQATCLHMAAANGHSKTVTLILSLLPVKSSSISTSPPPPSDIADSKQQQQNSQQTKTEPEPAYINAKNSFGNTALHWACLGGHLDVVKLLLSRGAQPAAVNDKDQIPLDLAAFNNHMHVVDYFLSQSRDIEGSNAKESGGEALASGVQDVEMGEDDDGGNAEGGEKVSASGSGNGNGTAVGSSGGGGGT